MEVEPFLMPFQDSPFNGDIHLCEEFLKIKKDSGIETVIELGSCLGVTTKWLGENFKQVFTIEISPKYHQFCLKRVQGMSNVVSILGDTISQLPSVLAQCDNKTIIFADSHWGSSNPLLKELEIIKLSGLQPFLIIHDFQNPDVPDMGYDVYPNQNIVYNWQWIESRIKDIYPDFNRYYNQQATGARRGCVFITPK